MQLQLRRAFAAHGLAVSAFATLVLSGAAGDAAAQTKEYPDGHGGSVSFPLGDASFADALTSFVIGAPDGGPAASDPRTALGVPDYVAGPETGAVTLGCGGVLTASFTDNALIDVAGPDLYVFEVGPAIEPTSLAISSDGSIWTAVGMISGGKAEVDIGDFVPSGSVFRFVRLSDLRTDCSEYPGADIDAIGAIGAATKLSLDASVLFDSGKFALKPAATAALQGALAQIGRNSAPRLVVEGHTDSVGSDAANQTLSEQRAGAVAEWFAASGGIPAALIDVRGYGETQAVSTNDTDAGRAANRRVEVVILTEAPQPANGDKVLRQVVGLWSSTEGLMQLIRQGDIVTGSYGKDGRVEGTFTSETTLDGYWIESEANATCPTDRDGSPHWGRLRIDFADTGLDSLQATWGECDAAPDHGGWTGEKLR